MSQPKSNHYSIEWRAIGKSVMGASHERAGLPNQDAIEISPESGESLPLVFAISDGHGSGKSFRSDLGSRFAVKTAQTVLAEFLRQLVQFDQLPEDKRLSAIHGLAKEQLPVNIVRQWHDEVKNHLSKHPFSEKELARLQEKSGAAALKAVQENPSYAYGATLLVTAITENFILYLQLGDGDILTVSELDEVRNPIPKDQRLMANETTSLCLPEAARDFRIIFQVLSGSPPALIMLSTDGYSNSFSNEAGFHQVGSDILNMIRRDGIKTVAATLESWLNTTSKQGSGDDITVGVIKRLEERDTDAIIHRQNRLERKLEAVARNLVPQSAPNQEIIIGRIKEIKTLAISALAVSVAGFLLVFWLALGTPGMPSQEKKSRSSPADTSQAAAKQNQSAATAQGQAAEQRTRRLEEASRATKTVEDSLKVRQELEQLQKLEEELQAAKTLDDSLKVLKKFEPLLKK